MTMAEKRYTVSQVARMARVTVRTLHHYDEIGLLVPSSRSASGYRLYTDADLQQLHRILLLRELGFSLEAIRRLLDDPTYDLLEALRAQRELLSERLRKTQAVLRAVDRALEALEGRTAMKPDELFEGFEDFDHAKYEEEARERWGHTEAYRESARRTRNYGKEDWAKIKAESEALLQEMAALLAAGRSPDEPEAMELAERHRQHIDRWFYPLSHNAHRCLAELYESDARFRENYEKRAPGLAAFVAAAIRANAARAARG
jgi:DNA-binding transcriptional MerR regulator